MSKEQWIKQQRAKQREGRWRDDIAKVLIKKKRISVQELFAETRPGETRSRFLIGKSIASQLNYLKDDGVFAHTKNGVVYLDSYWDDTKGSPVEVK